MAASGREGSSWYSTAPAVALAHHHVDPALAQSAAACASSTVRTSRSGPFSRAARSSAAVGPTMTATADGAGRPVAEGQAQAHREQDREDEAPEHDLRLAVELAKAHEAQGREGPQARLVNHPAGASR